jgi:hypothetical protein
MEPPPTVVGLVCYLRYHDSIRFWQPRPLAEIRQLRSSCADDETRTTMLSVAAHIRQANVRRSKPGLSGSRRERIIGASQSAQNGRSLVALPWKNEGTERLSITLPLIGGSATLSVTDSCRDGAVMRQYGISGRDPLVNIAHFQNPKPPPPWIGSGTLLF